MAQQYIQFRLASRQPPQQQNSTYIICCLMSILLILPVVYATDTHCMYSIIILVVLVFIHLQTFSILFPCMLCHACHIQNLFLDDTILI